MAAPLKIRTIMETIAESTHQRLGPPRPNNGAAFRRNGTLHPPSPQQVSILLVDDRDDKLLALEAVLSKLGQTLVSARSGKEALRHLLKTEFAVILLDVSMPGMDGFETAALIRQRPRNEQTPIIFVTSVDQSQTQAYKGYSLGAVDYLLTPIVPEVLRAKVGVFVDLYLKTEQIKRQAEQIHQFNAALQGQVSALTEVNKELEAFNHSISHDLRAPLRSMQSFAQILLDDHGPNLGKEGADLASRIVRSSHYLDELLTDLLTYSRLTHAEIPCVAIDLDEALAQVLSLLEKDIRDKAAVLEPRAPLGCVLGDQPTTIQILANLVGNALKFVAAGQIPRIRIASARTGNWLRVSVQDDGIGIDPQHHCKIFGLFERLHSTQDYPGTGIGLALVRKGVERMGGRVGLTSEPGKGSLFWVDLPASENK